MSNFQLDSRLERDSYSLFEDGELLIRVSKNSLFPWFLIVPKTERIDYFQLESDLKERVATISDRLSLFLKNVIGVDKVNIASIGNVVPQLHIHIVGRYFNDPCFPNPVWGCDKFDEYSEERLNSFIKKFKDFWDRE
jgi:diadenosine tetraphosphate (Ap4A) HIT family hydrolase